MEPAKKNSARSFHSDGKKKNLRLPILKQAAIPPANLKNLDRPPRLSEFNPEQPEERLALPLPLIKVDADEKYPVLFKN